MKVVFISNFMNHHQLYVAEEFLKQLGEDNYKFVACTEFDKERLLVGYKDMNNIYDFIIRAYESKSDYNKAKKAIRDADAIVFGSGYERLFAYAVHCKAMLFRYSERIYRSGYKHAKSLKHRIYMWMLHSRYRNRNVNLLCASAYAAGDYSLLNNYLDRCYKWGYFPSIKIYNEENLMEQKYDDKINILWVGRFLKLKHPEIVVKLSERLDKEGNKNFCIKMIGNGEELQSIKDSIKETGQEGNIRLMGGMAPEQVRKEMEKANIFLFTSDYNEGWGAVLNEAMNSGCACVASQAIGAVPFLIMDKENGLVYKNGDFEDFYRNFKKLFEDKEYTKKIGKAAYETIVDEWNPKNAVKKFVKLVDCIKNNKTIESGVCSKAMLIFNDCSQEI